MKYFLMAIVLAVAGYLAWQQWQSKIEPPPAPVAPPAPPIAPPVVLPKASPILTSAEQARVIKSTNDEDPNVRWEAIVFLDKMNVPIAMDIMLTKIHRDIDTDLRVKVIKLLAQHGSQQPADARIMKNLIQAARDPESDIRLAALQALEAMGNYSAASAITNSLRDQDESVRLQALKTLNTLQDKKNAAIEAERKHQEEIRLQAEQAAKTH